MKVLITLTTVFVAVVVAGILIIRRDKKMSEAVERIKQAAEDVKAAAVNISQDAGNIKTLVEGLKGTVASLEQTVQQLTDQIAAGGLDQEALDAVTATLNATKETLQTADAALDEIAPDAEPAPAEEPTI